MCVTIYVAIMRKIEMSILLPTKEIDLEFPDTMHGSGSVVLRMNGVDNDCGLGSCGAPNDLSRIVEPRQLFGLFNSQFCGEYLHFRWYRDLKRKVENS